MVSTCGRTGKVGRIGRAFGTIPSGPAEAQVEEIKSCLEGRVR